MARKRATFLLRPTQSLNYPPCDMRRYVELVAGRRRKDMSKAERLNPAMGVGPLMRNFIIDDLASYSMFDGELRQRRSFPIDVAHASGPASLSDAALFRWRFNVYRNYLHSYIPAEVPLFDTKSQEFIDWVNKGVYIANGRHLSNVNHALELVMYEGRAYKRKADHFIRHFFYLPEYLADRALLEMAGWSLGEYRLPDPEPDPAQDDEGDLEDDPEGY